MLQVGNRGLTLTEQKSHFSLWALIASPLLIGTIRHTTPRAWLDLGILDLTLAASELTAELNTPYLLFVGTDLADLDNDTLTVLSNPEVLAVSQDVLGIQGVRVSNANLTGTECWAKKLHDGSVAGIIVNRSEQTQAGQCTWQELGFEANVTLQLRNVWTHRDMGPLQNGVTVNLASHDVLMFVANKA
jgi:alpha-galactosidase